MISRFTMNLIEQDPGDFIDLIGHYEEILGREFESTNEISKYIYKVYSNANIIHNDDIKGDKDNESMFIDYFNKKYKTNYKTINEIQDNENIDLVRGDKIYAIIG